MNDHTVQLQFLRYDLPKFYSAWTIDSSDKEGITVILKNALVTAKHTLRHHYYLAAQLYGALNVIDDHLHVDITDNTLRGLMVSLYVLDYYTNRCTPPQFQPGMLTTPYNQAIWKRLQPYFNQRLSAALHENLTESLIWRAIIFRIPNNWIPDRVVAERTQIFLSQGTDTARVEVCAKLHMPYPGGMNWWRAHLKEETTYLCRQIKNNIPVLLDVFTEPREVMNGQQFLIARSIQNIGDSELDIHCINMPEGQHLKLRISNTNESPEILSSTDTNETRLVFAFRCWRIPQATPPLFGLRRYTRYLFPWSLLWRYRHRKQE